MDAHFAAPTITTFNQRLLDDPRFAKLQRQRWTYTTTNTNSWMNRGARDATPQVRFLLFIYFVTKWSFNNRSTAKTMKVIKWMPISLLQQLPHSTNVSSTIRDSLNCDGNDEHTPPPIPTPGWTEGLDSRDASASRDSGKFLFSPFFCSTNDF